MKNFYKLGVLLLLLLGTSFVLSAQIAALEKVTKTETFNFTLLADDTNYKKSFPITVDNVGKLTGKLTCVTTGDVPPNYNHLSFLLYQRDHALLPGVRDNSNFKSTATLSTEITENDLTNVKEFLFTARLWLAYVQCDCTLEVNHIESVTFEKVKPNNIPVELKKPQSKVEPKKIPVKKVIVK